VKHKRKVLALATIHKYELITNDNMLHQKRHTYYGTKVCLATNLEDD